MKSIVSIFLAVMMLVSSSALATAPVGMDDELARAISLQLVPEDLQSDLTANISPMEMNEMTKQFLKAYNASLLDQWQARINEDAAQQGTVQRDYAALWLLELADICGAAQYNVPNGFNMDGMDWNVFWNELSWNYPAFSNVHGTMESMTAQVGFDVNYALAAALFAPQRCSYVSGLPVLKLQLTTQGAFASGPALAREEAVRAFLRLYESLGQHDNGNVCTIPEDIISLSNKMPEATLEHLPKWAGVTLTNKAWYSPTDEGVCYNYHENDVVDIAQMGFDFVRVPLAYNAVFTSDDTTEQLCEPSLIDIDHLIGRCIQNGLHVCIDLHNMRGHITGEEDSRNLNYDEEAQRHFIAFWSTLAKRYANVSPNALSFNLLNEPSEFNDDEYTKLMERAILEIRKQEPNRLIFVDMLNYGTSPCKGLLNAGVVYAIHCYQPNGFPEAGLQDEGELERALWPFQNGSQTYDGSSLREWMAQYESFSKESGVPVMLQEFGVYYKVDYPSAIAYYDDLLTAANECNLGWCAWDYQGNFGIVSRNGMAKRDGAEYVELSEGREVAAELLAVFQKHQTTH